MRVTKGRMMLGGLLLAAGVVVSQAPSQATPAAGVTASPLIRGTFTDDVSAKFTFSHGGRTHVSHAKDASQAVFQSIAIAPGGHTGWHSHPGPVVVTVKSGTLSYYEGSGPCVARSYPAGTAFIDPGRGHVHIARNEGGTTLEIEALYLAVPAGAPARIDAPAPGNCAF